MPFIAIIIILLILFTALQFGLSVAYLSRTKVRDALDSAVLSAVSLADIREEPTYYGERWESDGKGGGRWVRTTSGYVKYLVISKEDAEEIAEEYFAKNLMLSKLKGYNIIGFKLKLTKDENMIEVEKIRPNTEGIDYKSWEQNFPQYILADATARVEVPAPLGGVFGRDTMIVTINAQSKKDVKPAKGGGGKWN